MRVHRPARFLIGLGMLAGGVACSDASAPSPPDGPSVRRIAACRGPALDLPEAARASLTGSGLLVTSDHRWATLAREVPGGFAGVFYDGGRPVLMLTDPTRAAAAKAALASRIPGFPVAAAEVRRARWTFAQLVEWSGHLKRNATLWQAGGIMSADRDEVENRLVYGVADAAALDRVAAMLAALDLPCDLVLLRIEGIVSVGRGEAGDG